MWVEDRILLINTEVGVLFCCLFFVPMDFTFTKDVLERTSELDVGSWNEKAELRPVKPQSWDRNCRCPLYVPFSAGRKCGCCQLLNGSPLARQLLLYFPQLGCKET